MDQITALDEALIREFVGSTSIQRARAYLQRDALHHMTRSNQTLRAHCDGSRQEPYLVLARFTEHGVVHAHCTCPVGAEGKCKHVAALLLQFIASPQDFAPTLPIPQALARRTRHELEALLTFIIARHPELESLLEMPLPTDSPRDQPITGELFRQQAMGVFRELGAGQGASSQIVAHLQPLLQLATQFLDRDDPQACTIISISTMETILAQAPTLHDDVGAFDLILSQLLEQLIACLHHPQSARSVRSQLLLALLELSLLEPPFAPTTQGIARDAMLTETHAEDRQELALHLRQRLTSPEHPLQRQDHWLLILLEQDHLDDKTYIERCKNLGRHDAVIRRLIELGHIDEAIDQARQTQEATFLAMIQEFTARGFAAQVEPLVRERFAQHGGTPLGRWLEQRLIQDQAWVPALAMAQSRFLRRPELSSWLDVKHLATHANQWELLRPALLAHLRELKDYITLTRCLLDEQQLDLALDALEHAEATGQLTGPARSALELEVAQCLTDARPHAALHLYQRLAERALHQRSVEGFESATQWLLIARELQQRLDQLPQWRRYMDDLVERFGRLQGLRQLWAQHELI